jgi:hypothetical protein
MLLMKLYTDITSLALSLDMATLHQLTASLLPSHKLFAILRERVRSVRSGVHLDSAPKTGEYALVLCIFGDFCFSYRRSHSPNYPNPS